MAQAVNVTYLTMQVRRGKQDVRVMISGIEPGQLGAPNHLVAGRPITRSHYEAVADIKTGFKVGERIRIRRNDYTVVGLTKRMVSSGGDPMVFIPLRDAQEAQFLKDNDAIQRPQPPRRQPRRQSSRPARRAGCGGGDPDRQPQRQRRPGAGGGGAGRRARWPTTSSAGSTSRLHQRRHGGHPGREADRHRVQADRPVPGHSGRCERGDRGASSSTR